MMAELEGAIQRLWEGLSESEHFTFGRATGSGSATDWVRSREGPWW